MKTITEIYKYVKQNCPFDFAELDHMNAREGSIAMKLAILLGVNEESASGNVNECAIAQMLYNQYLSENTTEPQGEPVPTPKFALNQTVYYLSEETIITSEVRAIHYRTSVNELFAVKEGFTYYGEFGQLPEKTFSTKSELVRDLIGDFSSGLCSEIFLF